MTVAWLLFVFTSAYVQQLGVYPDSGRCARAAATLEETLNVRPRAVMARFACIPTMVPMPMIRPAPEPEEGPTF